MKQFSMPRATRLGVTVGDGRPRVEALAEMPKHEAAAKGPLEEAARQSARVLELERAGRYDEAIPLARRALELRERALGSEHPDVATSLNNLAGLLQTKGDYAAAEPLHRRALAIREKALGPEHPDVATSLNDLAGLLQAKGDYAAAEPLYRRALAIREKALGPEHPDVAQSLNNLFLLLRARGDYAAAEPLYRRALAIREKVLGPEHPNVATSLNELALLFKARGDYAAAEPLFRRALAIREKALGTEHPDVATSLTNLAGLLKAKREYAAAEPLFRRALAIREKALWADHPDVATSLTNLALLLQAKVDYAAAEPLLRRALAIREKALGTEHPEVAASLNTLAGLLRTKGDYAAAEPVGSRALAIREKALGPEHPDLAHSLNELALLFKTKGDYAAAEPLYRRALAIREKALAPRHPYVVTSLSNLALLLEAKGDYAAAEPLLHRVLALREKALGPEHPEVAIALNNLAALHWAKGDHAAAEPLYRRALAIREKALGPEHPEVATSLNNLAGFLLRAKGDHVAAEPLLRRAIAILEKTLGPEHPHVAGSLNNLTGALLAKSDYAAAEPLVRRAIAILEKTLGPAHPHVAGSVNNLAALHWAKGDYAAAEPLLRRALAIREKALGPEHPAVAQSLNHLAALHWAGSAPTQALPLLQRASAIHERALAAVLAASSERQKHTFAWTVQGETDRTVSLHVRALPDRADAARLALTVLLQRKGGVLDAMTDMLAQLRARGRPEDQAKLAQLASLRGELATRTLRGPAPGEDVSHHSDTLASLRTDAEALERDLAEQYKALAVERRAVTLEAVQAALGPDAALIEIALFHPFDPHATPKPRFGDPHYVAYVLHPTGDPTWVELGPAVLIDALIARARSALSEADPRYAEAARALDERVMQPVRQLLGEAREVYLSPDGALNLVPFAALVDERGHFLLARYRFTYLTSGRDLLRLQVTQTESPRSSPLVIGNPAYDEGGSAPAGATSGRRSDAMGTTHFVPLRWTGPEARAVKERLPDARLLLDKDATEAAVKALAGPAIVHMATHGFFLAQARAAPLAPGEARPFLTLVQPEALPPLRESALLRSGLALAGANLRRSGGEDGVLTALEVAGLDLWGTKLVVLSACETGVGTLYWGEGVYGLRRALVLAGADSQIMSLWQVADKETQALMTAYYGRLSADEGRSDALREVQITMARTGLHPYYWAAFIAGGSGRSLSGKEPPAVRQADLERALDTAGAAP
ncbi:tetratricopeptide repeat protein [Sorangium sp. So ce367]|uniref:CHAT domain-containing tetratricopeptide repeat protein n=1 Tax=Sorangium sp. So ce367 TaxID=3133305 RepID=UPI003F5EB264